MCLLLFYLNPDALAGEYYLILINVRDEIYDRPTKEAHFWENHPDIIGGIDATPGKEGGTWFAASKSGKIAALLNILQPDEEIAENKKGRGFLVVDYVSGSRDCPNYLKDISLEGDKYNGFTLVTIDLSSFKTPQLAYFSNMTSSSPTTLKVGIHAFGNSTSVDCPWPKVVQAKQRFSAVVGRHGASTAHRDSLVGELFDLLRDSTCYTLDENMKQQGKSKSLQFLDKLSSIFVDIPEYNYGSRCHVILLIDGSGQADYYERTRTPHSTPVSWNTQHFTYQLNS